MEGHWYLNMLNVHKTWLEYEAPTNSKKQFYHVHDSNSDAIWLAVAEWKSVFLSFIETLKWIGGRDKAPDDLGLLGPRRPEMTQKGW